MGSQKRNEVRGNTVHVPEIALVAVAGAMGAACRYGVGIASNRLFQGPFPYETFAVNVSGCFIMGLVMHLALTAKLPPPAVSAIAVGFLGAFTTFSAFGYATLRLLEAGDFGTAIWNVLANVLLGLLASWGGVALGRVLVGNAY